MRIGCSKPLFDSDYDADSLSKYVYTADEAVQYEHTEFATLHHHRPPVWWIRWMHSVSRCAGGTRALE